MLIKKGTVFTPDFVFRKQNIRIKEGTITEVCEGDMEALPGEEVIDAGGKFIIPGLTDIHFHGAMGADICDASEDAVKNLAEYEFSVGVTQICPATMTLPAEKVLTICRNAYDYARKKRSDTEAYKKRESLLVGINLEGPYISPDRVGAQNPAYVQRADAAFLKKLIDETDNLPKLITIAPEIPENLDCISKLSDEIRFSVGHTMADYDQARKAFEAGARHMTHLYNAMPGLTHRAPGPIAAGAEREDVTAELICDGGHIAGGAVKAAFKLFGSERMILISDSARSTGLADGEYELGGLPVFKHDGATWLTPEPPEKNTLAASSTNLFDCMLKAMEMGIPAEQAIRAATYNPASAIGILDNYGSIETGKSGRLLILNKDYTLDKVL